MSKLLSRIENLERTIGDRRFRHVAHFRADGSLVPLPPGEKYGRHVALMPEVCATPEEWQKLYAPRAGEDWKTALARHQATLARANTELVLSRLRDGSPLLARKDTR